MAARLRGPVSKRRTTMRKKEAACSVSPERLAPSARGEKR
jgi:hypothetical protein